ncbi:MAG: nuclear transport factor 2 family protein [Bacteroidia bacterium]|nr:nuclear transport factor 2 family protein [Bacteroidia bacterium]
MNTTNEALIEQFYTAFAQLNAETMVACYDDNIIFEDPAFGVLHGNDAKNMWRMLTANNKIQLKVTFDCVNANDSTGSANWTAHYLFSKTGRKVTNRISAKFEFKNGKITKHTDSFNFWLWSRQALGFAGYALGWTPFLKHKVQQNTKALLNTYSTK